MTEPATTEELRYLRTAVASLTKLTFAMTRLLIQHGIAPDLETKRLVGSLRTDVLDEHLRDGWEREVAATSDTGAIRPDGSTIVRRQTVIPD